ncbi:MAG TPA: DUF1684 domain-containing protein [Thermoanaerobaculaceae bacterium]|nr:DUF1684 domain-containing protein [Thermoanaerobaculaceae bacterium]HPS77413.1 DUF1684 domain-containing protein [Thermoanaerobaculaceae bacterium]
MELPAARQASFGGLRFYPHDPAYRLRAVVQAQPSPIALTLTTSDGTARPARRVGSARLRFPAGEGTLALYTLDDAADDHLFVPFRDTGAGRDTYGAGRYVEAKLLAGGVVELDFNRAYNPDCAYGIAASCPITPAENTLPFAVSAGEMMPAGH